MNADIFTQSVGLGNINPIDIGGVSNMGEH